MSSSEFEHLLYIYSFLFWGEDILATISYISRFYNFIIRIHRLISEKTSLKLGIFSSFSASPQMTNYLK